MRGLSGKVALVMGAARPPGVGSAVARRLGAAGCQVVCAENVVPAGPDGTPSHTAGATQKALDEVVGQLREAGSAPLPFACDPAQATDVDAAVNATLAAFGRLDLCFHASGGLGVELGASPVVDVSPADFDRGIAANLRSAFLVATASARQMLAQGDGGSVVLMSSSAARLQQPSPRDTGVFAAAKAGVERLVTALAWELGDDGIRVNAVRPLGVDPVAGGRNPFLDLASGTGAAAESRARWAREHIALRRHQHPDETAAVVTFLLSDEASFVTGEIIDATGGGHQ